MRVGAAVAVLVVLSLCGCVATPPAGPTEAELASMQQDALEKTWAGTGLPGSPPTVEAGPAVPNDAWGQAVFTCMQEDGFALEGFQWSFETGAALGTGGNDSVDDPDTQLAFYRCIAANPRQQSVDDLTLTDAQLNYIYDYYQSTLVPCMIMNGFTPTTAPSRVEFLALKGQWNPYYSVDVGISAVQYEELERICGPQRPELY